MLGQAAMAALGVGAQVGVLLPFSRKHESEADYIGILLAADAGYDPRESVALWERMGQMSGGGAPSEFMSTHPSHETRIDQLKKWMPEAMAIYQTKQPVPAALLPRRAVGRGIRGEPLKARASSPIVLWREGEDWVIARSGNALRGKSGLHGQGAG